MKAKDYYIGLDCGTSSVGWAVTDPEYNLLKAKNKTLWGSRLFDEAKTAADRRTARSSRRRTRRSAERIKLLNLLFQDEIAKVDSEFFLRLKKSFLLEEDKNLKNNSKNTLFNDSNFKDKDFHKKYPTIWHLKKAIIEAPLDKHFDIRLYYLAIHHILKNRGHFLRSGPMKGAGDFTPIYDNFCEMSSNFNLGLADDMGDSLKSILADKKLHIRDRRKNIRETIFIETGEDSANLKKHQDELAGLLAGSKICPLVIFDSDADKDATKISFSDSRIEDKLLTLESELDPEQYELIMKAKEIYDYAFLSDLLNGEEFISVAMVRNYDLHKEQLSELKRLLKPFQEDYDAFFKTKLITKSEICYNAYIGKAYSEDKQHRRKSVGVSQEGLNKEIKRLLEKHNLNTPLLTLAEEGKLLPKQKGQAKGTIPEQLHHNELGIILAHLEKDYPSFSRVDSSEPAEYNTVSKKIASIHNFRIPYYCGPLVTSTKSQFSWADEEISQLIRPWNFFNIVNLDDRTNKFIRRMTNQCTYLPSEDVLPKSSPLYQKYMILNELNNLKLNGRRLEDSSLKQEIFNHVFVNGEIQGNVTLKQLARWLRENGYTGPDDTVSGSAENKFLPKLSTHLDFQRLFGQDYSTKFTETQIENTVELVTILNNEPKMLVKKILETLPGCTETQAKKLARKSYKDWGRFSKAFLTNICADINSKNLNIIDALWETNLNLMELLGNKYHFADAIEQYNRPIESKVTYETVSNLYCSPAVKRGIWQSLKIVDELSNVLGCPPAKIFIESTRSGSVNNRGKENLSRHHQLLELYRSIKNSSETKALLDELKSLEPRDLQSKKLFLYFTQMGRCAYSGERINLEELMTKAYDIDHIFPRSKTKDDSITRNLVLVKAEYNRDKSARYPIDEQWRKKMTPTWNFWYQSGLITKEKYERLSRANPLTLDELSGFISRQIVETSQTTKALKNLLAQKYPNTKIVLVKAGQVSDFRHHFASGNDNPKKGPTFDPKPEFTKVRAINDLHHAKDAYLNIVVGNVISETFTDNPYTWLKHPENQNYSINPHVIWAIKPIYQNFPKGWGYSRTVDLISKNLYKDYSILWTRMPYEQTGAISDLQLVGKSKNTDGIIPAKRYLDPEKYGGYNSIKGTYFALIELPVKNELHRKIVQIPILAKDNPDSYLRQTYPDATIILPKILTGSLFEINGNRLIISGRTGDRLMFFPASQLYLGPAIAAYLKKVTNASAKLKAVKGYALDKDRDRVDAEQNIRAYRAIAERLKIMQNIPWLGGYVEKIADGEASFSQLPVETQCEILEQILAAFQCNAGYQNLSKFLSKATVVGKSQVSNDITNLASIFLIHQSPTGLFEYIVDLKTINPGTR